MPSLYVAGELANTTLKCAEVPSTSWKGLDVNLGQKGWVWTAEEKQLRDGLQ